MTLFFEMIFCIGGFLPMKPISMGVCLDVGMIGLENGSIVFIEDGIKWVRSVISVPMPMLR